MSELICPDETAPGLTLLLSERTKEVSQATRPERPTSCLPDWSESPHAREIEIQTFIMKSCYSGNIGISFTVGLPTSL